MTWRIEYSRHDPSTNFIKEYDGSVIECRYVRRTDEQLIVYLSSHNGCAMSCRFCHLTGSGQTSMSEVTPEGFLDQAKAVFDYWSTHTLNGHEKIVNFNWMARGEPLENSHIKNNWRQISSSLERMAERYDLVPVFNISTIIPKSFDRLLFDTFDVHDTRICWSLYSVSQKFRKKWLPKAQEPAAAIPNVLNWLDCGGQLILHNVFISGHNDSEEDIDKLTTFIQKNELQGCGFNIVRYNPYSERYGVETPEERLLEIVDTLSKVMKGRVQLVPRVRPDVYASCGQFVPKGV